MDYDTFLLNLADSYYKECKPEYTVPPSEYSTGEINCHECDNIDCIYYRDYHNE